MPPQSRGGRLGVHSQSTPNLSTLRSLRAINTAVADHGSSNISQVPAPQTVASERFPDLDGSDEEGSSNVDEDYQNTYARPRDDRNKLFPLASEDHSSEDDDEDESDNEEEEEDDEDDRSSSGASQLSSEHSLNNFAFSGSEGEEEEGGSSEGEEQETPSRRSDLSSTSSSHPSTLRPPLSAHSSSVPSSAQTSPQKFSRPPPNRTQSLYTQPPSLTKSQPSTLGATLQPSFSPTRTNSSLHIPAAFAPPFYNRPPTPLPPSPSLTSLLRPPFSTTFPSRPATPGTRTPVDSSSDTEGTYASRIASTIPGTATGTSAAASTTSLNATALAAPVQPPSAPKIPTYEYYGFTLYIGSSLIFFLYLLWSYLPTPFLHVLGIYYYPNRWWSLAIPAWLVVFLIWIYIALASYNTGSLTLPVGDLGCMVDEKGAVAGMEHDWTKKRLGKQLRRRGGQHAGDRRGRSTGTVKRQMRSGSRGKKKRRRDKQVWNEKTYDDEDVDWQTLWNEGTDAVLDIPIGGVCEVLYSTDQELDGDWDGRAISEPLDAG